MLDSNLVLNSIVTAIDEVMIYCVDFDLKLIYFTEYFKKHVKEHFLVDLFENINLSNIFTDRRLLKISVDFVLLQKAYITKKKSYEKLREKRTQYDPDFLITLENEIKNLDEEFTIKELSINDIQPGMILSKDIKDNNNVLIMSKETIVTDILQQKIFSFLRFKRLDKNYKVFVKEYKK